MLGSILSCALGLWMLWHYTSFLLVGVITLFRFPFELISLSTIGARLAAVCASLATFALFAWLSLRVVMILMSGERNAHFGHVLGEDPYGEDVPGTADVTVPEHANRADTLAGRGISGGHRHVSPVSGTAGNLTRGYVRRTRQLAVPGASGKHRYLSRPYSLTSGPPSNSFMHGLSYRRGIARDKASRCRALGWPAFEWVFRTAPSLHEMVCSLEALPNLAQTADEEDASEARAWMSRLADHPGAYEMKLPDQEVINGIGSVEIRVADVATQALMDWDEERKKQEGRPDLNPGR